MQENQAIPSVTQESLVPSPSLDESPFVLADDGIRVEPARNYGIGIDTHSKFIQVSVIVRRDDYFYEYRCEFATDWPSLLESADWARTVVSKCSIPSVDATNLHYCIESTAVYHLPILMAWGGTPSIVTPSIAGSTVRKTDVLDAKTLAVQSLTSIWPESYVPSDDIKNLRVMIAERDNYKTLATRCSNRINNFLIRYGVTVGKDGSVTTNREIRRVVEKLVSDNPGKIPVHICPGGIPDEIKPLIRAESPKYDEFKLKADNYQKLIVAKVRSMGWETKDGILTGNDMLNILMTAPGIGITVACTWLAIVITPRRFPNDKAVAAYSGLDPSLKVSAKHVTSTVKRGGNKDLHYALCMSASILIKNHNEMFGRWGYQMYLETGRWKKATNAVARKLAVALYYMQSKGEVFSYEKYRLLRRPDVMDIPIDELVSLIPDFKRYIRHCKENDIYTTKQLADKYYACELHKVKGLGKKFFGLLREFFGNQPKYRNAYQNMHEEEICAKK